MLLIVAPIALLHSCSGCSSKSVGASSAVQNTSAVQTKPAPAVEKETAPEVQSAEAAQVAEETPAEAVAEKAAVEPVSEETTAESEAEEESVSAEEERAPIAAASAPVAAAEKAAEPAPAEEPIEEKALAQEAAPAAEDSEPDEKICGSHILTLGISPWGWQHFHIDKSGIDDKNSTYGLGGKIAYTYLFNNGFYVGAEAAYETYFIDHKDNFHDIMFFVDGGYNFALTENLGLYVGLGGGIELECYESECSAVGLVKGDLGLGYSLTEHWILGVGCDLIVGFPTKSDVNYRGFQIISYITASYKF